MEKREGGRRGRISAGPHLITLCARARHSVPGEIKGVSKSLQELFKTLPASGQKHRLTCSAPCPSLLSLKVERKAKGIWACFTVVSYC